VGIGQRTQLAAEIAERFADPCQTDSGEAEVGVGYLPLVRQAVDGFHELFVGATLGADVDGASQSQDRLGGRAVAIQPADPHPGLQ
jgi:hypothetical protein